MISDNTLVSSPSAATTADASTFAPRTFARGPVSSDDPDGIEKLTAQLEERQRKQEAMKQVNKLVRKNDSAGLLRLGYSESVVKGFFTPDFCSRLGFASYEITNNASNIKRIEARIEELKDRAKRLDEPDEEITGNGYVYREDKGENRVMFIFSGKPSEEVRTRLKRRGFKWSPTRNAWVRLLTANAEWAGKTLRAEIDKLLAA